MKKRFNYIDLINNRHEKFMHMKYHLQGNFFQERPAFHQQYSKNYLMNSGKGPTFHILSYFINFMATYYGLCSTAPRPLQEGSLLFTTKLPEIPGTHLIDLRKMKGRVNLGATQRF